jgi:tungstate transport system ATP-binding protein
MADIFPLRARALTVRFGDSTVLHRATFELAEGARIAVLGANGAGKSVLLRALHGLIEPTTGEITWGGSTQRPREQAMVFQRPVVLRRSALANIEYALAVNGVSGPKRRQRAREALERVALGYTAERPARVLSGGEQQRLALARAWALAPRVLFLDEPTASLDPRSAAEVERVISEIHASGTAVRRRHACARLRAAHVRRGAAVERRRGRGAHAHRALLHQSRNARRRKIPQRGAAMERYLARLYSRISIAWLAAAFIAATLLASTGAQGRGLHHGRVDHLDRAIGPVQAPAARGEEGLSASTSAWSRSARGRRSTWDGAGMPTWNSSTTRWPRRNSSPRVSA